MAEKRGRRQGKPNYRPTILLDMIREILPSGALDLNIVAERYGIPSTVEIA